MFLLGLPRVPEVLQEQTGQVTCPIFFFPWRLQGHLGRKHHQSPSQGLGEGLFFVNSVD